MPISIQPRQGTEELFLPLTQPIALPNPQGIAAEENSLNSMRENAPTGPSSCSCSCFTWIKNVFSLLSLKFFGRSVTSEELMQKAEEIRGSHRVYHSNQATYPSKIIITIQLNGAFTAVIKENLGNALDAARFWQGYETTLRNTLQAQELSGDGVLTMTAYVYNRVDLTPEQVQARGRPETFVYNMFRSKNTHDFRSIWSDASRTLTSESYNQYNPHLLVFNEINEPRFRNEIQEFLAP